MDNKTEQLEKLKKRNEELKPVVFKGAKNENELDRYIKSTQKEYDEYYVNQKEIQQLEWELMTPEERAREEEVLRLMKEKRAGRLH